MARTRRCDDFITCSSYLSEFDSKSSITSGCRRSFTNARYLAQLSTIIAHLAPSDNNLLTSHNLTHNKDANLKVARCRKLLDMDYSSSAKPFFFLKACNCHQHRLHISSNSHLLLTIDADFFTVESP